MPELMVSEFSAPPMAMTQSACSMWRRASECEDEPRMPMSQGLPRNRSLALIVVTHNAPIFSASASTVARAPPRCTPMPPMMSGRLAFWIMATAVSMDCCRAGFGAGRVDSFTGDGPSATSV